MELINLASKMAPSKKTVTLSSWNIGASVCYNAEGFNASLAGNGGAAKFVCYDAGGSNASLAGNGGAAKSPRSLAKLPRALTSTPAERRRTVAACRALRTQITQFEDAFVRLHGRPPKGDAERAPLASTYMQYKEWKRAIRADAASRIQALFRAGRVRRAILRGEDQEKARFVAERILWCIANAGGWAKLRGEDQEKAQFVAERARHQQGVGGSSGDNVSPRGAGSPTYQPGYGTFAQASSSSGGSPRMSDGVGQGVGGQMDAAKSTASSAPSDVSLQDLDALKAEKARLHQMLRSYEKDFYRQHRRQVSSFGDIRSVASQYRRYTEIKEAIAQKTG